MSATEIACPCGSVRLRVDGEPEIAFYCHCDDCQAVTGAAYLSVALFPAAAVTVLAGETFAWKLRTLLRRRCTTCGALMFAEVPEFGQIGIPGNRLPRELLKPAFHIQCRYAVAPVVDGLPHYADTPTAFGGSGAKVVW